MSLVRPFPEIGLGDVAAVGGKGANLGELVRAGIDVPPGFVVTTESFNDFLEAIDADRTLRGAIGQLDAGDLSAIARSGETMRARMIESALPGALTDALANAYETLGGIVAVRSSATGEDSADASFAGLQDTYLWLSGTDTVAAHVRACWASLYSTESLSYRRRLGIGEDGLAMGVVVQRMVDSHCSGVMFTRSPATGDRSVIVIEGSYGLGSAVVSGEVTPDKYTVSKVTGEITGRAISQKLVRHVPNPEQGGVREEDVPDTLQSEPCLSDAQIASLAAVAKKVERHYSRPQDIEWAVARDGNLYLLQSRPETVWAKRDHEPVVKPKANALEHLFAALGGKRTP